MILFLTAKDYLYNDLSDLQSRKAVFSLDTKSTKNVNVLVNALWLIDKNNF